MDLPDSNSKAKLKNCGDELSLVSDYLKINASVKFLPVLTLL
jgi:hypothetical protein